MFAERIATTTGWQFQDAGEKSYRFTSPFTLGDDGQHLVFYVARPTDETYQITDFGETAMHADSMGVAISKQRRERLNESHGVTRAHFDDANRIVAEGPVDETSFALLDATKLALSLSFLMPRWVPKFHEMRFGAMVGEMLYGQFKERLLRKPTVTGISGKQIEFPFAIKMRDKLRFVSTISAADGVLDWSTVYQLLGKCTDAKQADELNERSIIIQDGVSNKEFGRAASLLAQCANVQSFSMAAAWAEVIAAE